MEGGVDSRNWADLFPDALGLIFSNLSLQETLTVVPRVCKSWNYGVLGGLNCWQTIDLLDWSLRREYSDSDHDIDKMLRFLITWSSGAFREIIVGSIQNDLTFSFIVDQ